MHMEWIPLKTPDGRLIGHAKVKDGFVGMSLKTGANGRAMVLTSAGSVHGAADARIAVLSPVLAAAVHDGGKLVCYGVARGAALSADDIRRRLPEGKNAPGRGVQRAERTRPAEAHGQDKGGGRSAGAAVFEAKAEGSAGSAPAAAEAPPVAVFAPSAPKERSAGAAGFEAKAEGGARSAPAPAEAPPVAVFAPSASDVSAAAAPAPAPAPAAPAAPTPAYLPTPAPAQGEREPIRAEAFRAQAESEAYPAFEDVVEAHAPVLPTSQDTAREAEAFFALLKRADRVYGAASETVSPASAPTERVTRSIYNGNNWHEEVDAFLERTNERVRTGVPNPFPHIFPNAAFTRIQKNGITERLEGDWRRGAARFMIHAVPGSYNPVPPAHLPGFTRYIRSRAGGFWVKVTEQ